MKKEPTEATKAKKKGGKLKWIIIVVVLLAIIGAAMGGGGDSSEDPKTAGTEDNTDATKPSEDEPQASDEDADSDVPAEYRSALAQAESYGETMHMSKQGIYDQLISEYGGQFTAEEAQYAIDNLQADYKANALEQAKSYQETMDMSHEAIRDQLVSEYGGQFTQEEADYAVANLE